jgi:glycosyltransferase involved in cell wall biosynthesis
MFMAQKYFRNQFKFAIKIIVFFVCVTLIPTEESRAALALSAQKIVSSDSSNSEASEFKIPGEFGTIEESYVGTNGQTMIYIQDAHDSLDAQENIANLIDYFVKHKKVKTVFTEGYEGKMLNDEYFGFIQDSELKRRVAYFLMDQLRIGGTEFAHINRCKSTKVCRKGDFDLIGADSFTLHHKSIEAYQHSAAKRDEIADDVLLLEKYIKNLADQYFPKELKEWMKLKNRLESNEINLFDYLKRMLAMDSDILADQTLRIPQIRLIFDTVNLKANQEALEKIQAKKLFEEVLLVEEQLAKIFLHNERDVLIFKYYESLGYLKKLNSISMTFEEYEVIQDVLKKIRTVEIADFVRKHSNHSLVLKKGWEDHIRYALQFYEMTAARDLKVVESLKNLDGDLGVLVFGGFHQANLKQLLKEAGYSYHIVIPRINELSERHQNYYRRLMRLGYGQPLLPGLIAKAAKQPTLQAEILLDPALRPQWDLWIRQILRAAEQTSSWSQSEAVTEMRLLMQNPDSAVAQFGRSELRSDLSVESPFEKFNETRLPTQLPQDYLIIVPTFNEQKNIQDYLQRIREQGYLNHVIYVDDASKDETVDFLREDADVHYMGLKENHQKEGALYQAVLALQQVYEERDIPFPKTFISVDADSFLSVNGSESVEEHLKKVIDDFEKQKFNMRGIKIEAYLTPDSRLSEWVEGVYWYLSNYFGRKKFAPGGAVIYNALAFQETMEGIDFDFESGPIQVFEALKEKGSHQLGLTVTSMVVKTEVFPTFFQLYREKEKWGRGLQKTLSSAVFKAFVLTLDLFMLDTLFSFRGRSDFYIFFTFLIVAPLGLWKIKQMVLNLFKRPRTEVNYFDAVLLLPMMMATYNAIYMIHLNMLLIKKRNPSISAKTRNGKETKAQSDLPSDSARHELRQQASTEGLVKTEQPSRSGSQISAYDQKQVTEKESTVSIENLLDQSMQSPASFFIHFSEVEDVESDVYKSLYALADQTKNHRDTHFVVYGIAAEDLTRGVWRELRSVGVKTLQEGLNVAYQRYGKKQIDEKSLKHNVHFATAATRLKEQAEDDILPFLSIGLDLPAALLLARSGGRMNGIQKKDGVYSVFDHALIKQLRAYQAQLVIAIAA